MPRRPSGDLLAVGPRVSRAVRAAGDVLATTGADVVVGFGGYVALPAYLAARRARVPIVVHEANARPGLANRVGARMTPFVAVTVPGSLPRGRHVGLPLRRSIETLDRSARRDEARRFFGLDPGLPTLLVFGGSQGARRLNLLMMQVRGALAAAGVQVLHAVGERNVDEAPVSDPAPPAYVALPYLDRMDLAYAAADVAVCRAGAMTCAELAAVGLPAAYVPLPIGNGEQRLNALPVVRAGGGLMVEDAEATPEWLLEHLLPLLADPARLAEMGSAASEHGVRDAGERLVAMVLEAVASARPSSTGG
jgi:UDP-N-acetylglucosamine--N-acetylmuramyl-(pentapeptide) pyrophosphoryl-undecaprenol N-acetylglucosamine transferase